MRYLRRGGWVLGGGSWLKITCAQQAWADALARAGASQPPTGMGTPLGGGGVGAAYPAGLRARRSSPFSPRSRASSGCVRCASRRPGRRSDAEWAQPSGRRAIALVLEKLDRDHRNRRQVHRQACCTQDLAPRASLDYRDQGVDRPGLRRV